MYAFWRQTDRQTSRWTELMRCPNDVTLKSRLGVVQGHRKMTQFDRPYRISYCSAIMIIALTCTIFELFNRDIEVWVKGHSRLLQI